MEINDKHDEYKGDIQKLLENDSIAFQRRKKLWEDFEKSESSNLEELRKNFIWHFDITIDQYEEEIGEFNGTTEEFYYYIRKNYESTGRTYKKRGRPSKK